MKTRFTNIFSILEKRNGTIILLVVILAVGILSGLSACTGGNPNMNPNELTDNLYQYKGTLVGDNSKVIAIVDLLPIGELLTRDKVVLQTYNTSYGVGVYYKTNDRAEVRDNIEQYDITFKRNAVVMFALIPNMDSLSIDMRDKYNLTDASDDCFGCTYMIFEDLNDFFGTDYFTKENLETAVASKDNFREFFAKVMSMETQYINKKASVVSKTINNTLGKGWEVRTNSGMGATFVLEKNIAAGGFDLAEALKTNNIDITEYFGKEVELHTYTVTNYTGQKPDTSYAFFSCGDKLIAHQNIGTDENARLLAIYCSEISQKQQNNPRKTIPRTFSVSGQ